MGLNLRASAPWDIESCNTPTSIHTLATPLHPTTVQNIWALPCPSPAQINRDQPTPPISEPMAANAAETNAQTHRQGGQRQPRVYLEYTPTPKPHEVLFNIPMGV
jgi:hypothetical protein